MEIGPDDLERSGERLNRAAETVPRIASSVIVVRDRPSGFELLLVKRSPAQRFMAGVWVFPGGAVDAVDGAGEAGHRAAAVRELEEEASIGGIAPAELIPYSRWITPSEVTVRFDTHFFLAPVADDVEARVDGLECVDAGWYTPTGALDAHGAGDILLVFPTIKHLEQLAGFPTASALFDHARGRPVVPVQPRVLTSGETARIVLPGEPGYDD